MYKMELTQEERDIILAYRQLKPEYKETIRAPLGVKAPTQIYKFKPKEEAEPRIKSE